MPYEVSGFCPSCGQFAPNHEQHSHWQQLKPLHKRTFAHHFGQFGTGEDRQIEDAVSPQTFGDKAEVGASGKEVFLTAGKRLSRTGEPSRFSSSSRAKTP